MKKIILDVSKINSNEELHEYIKCNMEFPDYYGMNLDALWDMLTTISDPLEIHMINFDKLYQNIGEYAGVLENVISMATKENDNLTFVIHKKENLERE